MKHKENCPVSKENPPLNSIQAGLDDIFCSCDNWKWEGTKYEKNVSETINRNKELALEMEKHERDCNECHDGVWHTSCKKLFNFIVEKYND